MIAWSHESDRDHAAGRVCSDVGVADLSSKPNAVGMRWGFLNALLTERVTIHAHEWQERMIILFFFNKSKTYIWLSNINMPCPVGMRN